MASNMWKLRKPATSDDRVKMSKQDVKELKRAITQLATDGKYNEQAPRILFMGEAGTGKSSLISSIVSAMQERITYTSTVGENRGLDGVDTPKRYSEHRIFPEDNDENTLNVVLCDSRGITKRRQTSTTDEEIHALIDGRLLHGDLIDHNEENASHLKQMINQRPANPPSCVVFVLKLCENGDSDPPFPDYLLRARALVREKGIPSCIALTHIDLVLKDNLHLALTNKKIDRKVQAICGQFGFNKNRVFVVKNYVDENRTRPCQDYLVLRALHAFLLDANQNSISRRGAGTGISTEDLLPLPCRETQPQTTSESGYQSQFDSVSLLSGDLDSISVSERPLLDNTRETHCRGGDQDSRSQGSVDQGSFNQASVGLPNQASVGLPNQASVGFLNQGSAGSSNESSFGFLGQGSLGSFNQGSFGSLSQGSVGLCDQASVGFFNQGSVGSLNEASPGLPYQASAGFFNEGSSVGSLNEASPGLPYQASAGFFTEVGSVSSLNQASLSSFNQPSLGLPYQGPVGFSNEGGSVGSLNQASLGSFNQASLGLPYQGSVASANQASVGLPNEGSVGLFNQASVGLLNQASLGLSYQASVRSLNEGSVDSLSQGPIGSLSQGYLGQGLLRQDEPVSLQAAANRLNLGPVYPDDYSERQKLFTARNMPLVVYGRHGHTENQQVGVLVNELRKDLTGTEVGERFMSAIREVVRYFLNEVMEANPDMAPEPLKGSVWMSTTLCEDLGLHLVRNGRLIYPPEAKNIYGLVVCPFTPCFVASIVSPDERTVSENDVNSAEDYNQCLVRCLDGELKLFCDQDVRFQSCVIPCGQLTGENLLRFVQTSERKARAYTDSRTSLRIRSETMYREVRLAVKNLSSVSSIPAYLNHPDKEEEQQELLLLDDDWIGVVHRIIEWLKTHEHETRRVRHVHFPPGMHFKLRVAVLEACQRLGLHHIIVVITNNQKVRQCCVRLVKEKQATENLTLHVTTRPSDQCRRVNADFVLSLETGHHMPNAPVCLQLTVRPPQHTGH